MQTPVTEFAVKHRLNRLLADKGKCLRKCRGNAPWLGELGNYYIAQINTDNIIQTDVDLEALARKEGAINSGEAISAGMQPLAPSLRRLHCAISY
jgi:hypothetical protein